MKSHDSKTKGASPANKLAPHGPAKQTGGKIGHKGTPSHSSTPGKKSGV